jgi:hypothetical protein
MKNTVLLFLFLILLSCNDQSGKIKVLEKKIDKLEKELSETYKPGFGELMTGVQAHHSKLWFAGEHKNWELAGFEVKELNEILDDINKYQKDREETKLMEMVNPALDSVKVAIAKKDQDLFRKTYFELTKSCNDCHKLTNFQYNIVKVPDVSPFTNQDFNTKK